ncbi:hypothetical protein, partial [Klebsiella pneumoniae]|uniref:hypothetical protein n=1 Tax=Klebsiella pneumoniae TaxID=573 RepID=UPI001955A8FA
LTALSAEFTIGEGELMAPDAPLVCRRMNMMISYQELVRTFPREGANKQVISSQADSLIKISRIWADFFPANTSNQPI